MRWNHFVEGLRNLSPPYEGKSDDFDAVKSYLDNNGHDSEAVDADGDTYVLKDLYDARPGRKLDMSAAAKAAEDEARIEARINAAVEELKATQGTGVREGGRTHHTHNVKVGKDRLTDDPDGGFKSVGHFGLDVVNAEVKGFMSPELDRWTKTASTTYSNEGTGAEGGFGVPPNFSDQILKRVMGEDSVLSRTNQFRISQGNSMTFPYDEDEPWNTSGIQAEWEGEAGTMTQRKVLLTQKELKLRKLVILAPVTEELLSDAPAIGGYLTSKAADVIDFKVGEAIFRGTGAGQPFGFLNSAGLIQQAAEGSQVADTVVAQNIIKMYSRMYGPHRANAVWFISQHIEYNLMIASIPGMDAGAPGTLTSTYGSSGVFLPGGSIAGQPFNTILGRPAITTQHCGSAGDVGDICFCAMDQYITLMKGTGIESTTSMHLWFDQDVTAFKFRMRMDGQPWSNNTITPRDTDADTLGSFIALAAR